MRKLYAFMAAASVCATAPAFAATTFQFDTNPANTFVTVLTNPTLCLGNCSVTASLATPFQSFSLNVGQSRTFDFANFTVGNGFGGGSATIDASLGFILPPAGPAGSGASASYLRFGGLFTGGSLTWDTPSQQLLAADGSLFTVSFGNLAGLTGSTATAPVTITLNRGAVPEPGTWAMMIVGFGAVGGVMRSARVRRKVAFAA
jgi:hypothetical protein